MPANKYALLRYRIIDRCINNRGGPYPTREQLRQECEDALYGSGGEAISLSTIDKDINAMRNESELGYYAPIKFSREHGGYYYDQENYSIEQLSLNDEDLEAIHFATATLEQFRHIPFLKQYESAIEKIVSRVRITPNPGEEGLEKFIQFETSTVTGGTAHLGKLLQNIRSQQMVRIRYRKFSDAQLKEYLLHPLLLKEYSNRWYLIARNDESQKIQTFGLERIEHLELGEKIFEPDPEFDPEIIFRYSIGITEAKEKPVAVILETDLALGRYLESQPIHPSQKTEVTGSGRMRFELFVTLTPELLTLILGYANQMKVIGPQRLEKMITEKLKATMDQYNPI